MPKHNFIKRNGLSLVLIMLMVVSLTGQICTGYNTHNQDLMEDGQSPLAVREYLSSGHFIQATFENWESEFLQMMLYVLLTISLRQKGSSESKPLDEPVDVDKEPQPHAKAPWPVRRGGWWLEIYKHSLSLAFGLLFLISFLLHFYGSLKDHNDEQQMNGLPVATAGEYLVQARFWFESFQNWQSEFLAVASIVLLSIWLREKGSPESKPVDMPHDENPS